MRKQQERLVQSCLQLVHWIVQRTAPPEFPFQSDLVQAGNLGLVEAATRYNPRRGVKFSTYAFEWIRRYVLTEMRSVCPVHVPQSRPFIEAMKPVSISLDKMRQEAEDRPHLKRLLGQILRDPSPSAESVFLQKEEVQLVQRAVRKLPLRQRRVLSLRRLRPKPLSLERVGLRIARTKERTRQIQLAAERRLALEVSTPQRPRR